MPLVLVDTAGSATANTYLSLTDAETYMLARPFSAAWTAATDAVKNQALVFATELLDRARWKGTKGITSSGALLQALSWPRRYAPTREFQHEADAIVDADDVIDVAIAYYDETAVPTPIKRATVEIALGLIKAGSSDPYDQDVKRIKSKTVDVLTTEFFDSQDQIRGLSRFPHALQEVAHLLRTEAFTEVLRG
jgi:hypothetical protein